MGGFAHVASCTWADPVTAQMVVACGSCHTLPVVVTTTDPWFTLPLLNPKLRNSTGLAGFPATFQGRSFPQSRCVFAPGSPTATALDTR